MNLQTKIDPNYYKLADAPPLAGLLESPKMSLDETLVLAEIMEAIRTQVGVVYPQDHA